MKWLKSYKKYTESLVVDLTIQSVDLMESLNIWHDILLNSINAEEVDMFDTLKLPNDSFKDSLDLDYLFNNVEFVNSLSSLALKKSQLEDTQTYQTFLKKPCKFMFIYGQEQNELENPIYIIFQIWDESLNKWGDSKLYKVNNDVKKFYDKLSSKTIELIDIVSGENYIYNTSNSNEWILQNSEKENDTYKKVFRKEELEELLNKNRIKLDLL
jgi:hypothetical protein